VPGSGAARIIMLLVAILVIFGLIAAMVATPAVT
jgi:hypothetical protein